MQQKNTFEFSFVTSQKDRMKCAQYFTMKQTIQISIKALLKFYSHKFVNIEKIKVH